MGKNFKNINEELERIKTLMYETDSLILNEKNLINEQTAPATPAAPATTTTPAVSEPQQGGKFKTARSSFKLAKVSDVNTVLRGGAAKFDTYKVKGTGVISLFDKDGKMTPEGIELMKKSGLKLPAGQIVMRIGKVDNPNTDKVFFQVIPSKEISVVTQSGDIKNVDPKELEQLPTVQDLKPTAPVAAAEVKPTGATTTTKTFVEDGSIFGKKIEDLEKEYGLKIKDLTSDFKRMGWTASAYYKKNEETKTIYGIDKDNRVKSMFKRMKSGGVAESFNMDLIFVNPLLFESVISEQETKTEGGESDYYVKIDASGKETKMSNKFTQVIDGTYKGGSGSGKSSGSSGSSGSSRTSTLSGATGSSGSSSANATPSNAIISQQDLIPKVDSVVTSVDGYVTYDDLVSIDSQLKTLKDKFYYDDVEDDDGKPRGFVPAMTKFLELYLEDEGENLIDDINSIGTATLKVGSVDLKNKILSKINSYPKTPVPQGLVPPKD